MGKASTLTDALVILGHLCPDALLDGAMPIDSAASRCAITNKLAEPLQITRNQE